MKNQTTTMCFVLALSFGGVNYAQKAVTSGGSDASSASGSVSFSIGQIDYSANSAVNGNVNQGVQQPIEFFSVGVIEKLNGESVSIFPNPTISSVKISIPSTYAGDVSYRLMDEQGKLIFNGNITGSLELDLNSLPVATYFLNLSTETINVGTYKLIKTQ